MRFLYRHEPKRLRNGWIKRRREFLNQAARPDCDELVLEPALKQNNSNDFHVRIRDGLPYVKIFGSMQKTLISISCADELTNRIPLAPHSPPHLFKRLHDLRVVWAFEIQGEANHVRHSHELVHRVF